MNISQRRGWEEGKSSLLFMGSLCLVDDQSWSCSRNLWSCSRNLPEMLWSCSRNAVVLLLDFGSVALLAEQPSRSRVVCSLLLVMHLIKSCTYYHGSCYHYRKMATMNVREMATMNVAAVTTSVDASLIDDGATHPSLCPLCCEVDLDAPPTDSVELSTCQHRSCKSCMVKWIEREEAAGQNALPTCPFCRSIIDSEDVIAILGRPFEPKQATVHDSNDAQTDELTLQWMQEHTVTCGVCGSRIEKESGCDKIECLCGYRFCFSCGAANAACSCNPGHRFNDDDGGHVAEEPVRDNDGRVDIASCINRRKVRKQRQKQRERNEDEAEDHWEYWEYADACPSNGRWLFSSKKKSSSISMLTQQLGHIVRMERGSRGLGIIQPSISLDTSWLFLRRGAEAPALKQLLRQDSVKHARARRRHRREEEEEDYFNNGASALTLSWLFLPNSKLGLKLLGGTMDALRKQMKRAGARRNRPSRGEDDGVVIFLASGAWLFHTKVLAKTNANLVRLWKHREKGSQKRFRKMVDEMFSGGCNAPNCPNCRGRNLDSILFVFPQQEE